MGRPFSNCIKACPLNLQVARLIGVGRELTSKWFSSQALFFLMVFYFVPLYINKWSDLFVYFRLVLVVCFYLLRVLISGRVWFVLFLGFLVYLVRV